MSVELFAERVFGSEEKAEAWLQTPSSALSGQHPVDLLREAAGLEIVRELLARIDHGIFT
jgi:putative toxin-antitoxin system antitoxin component (TIGR02293 family)